MITLKYFGDHLKDLEDAFSSFYSGDLVFETPGGSVRAHRLLLLAHLPTFSSLMCEGCDNRHEDTVIFLPEVDMEQLRVALEDLYKYNDGIKMSRLFGGLSLGNEDTLVESLFKSEQIQDVSRENNRQETIFREVQLMNKTFILQCIKCLDAVSDTLNHSCDLPLSKPTEETDIEFNFETVSFMNNDTLFRCIYCNIEVNTKEDALEHIKTHQEYKTGHMKQTSKEREIKENTDSFQPESKEVKMFVDPLVGQSVVKEIKVKSSVASFKCNFCSYLTTVETNMKKHKEKHQNPTDVPKNKYKEVLFSLDNFVAKVNKKGKHILICRKCLRKCKDIKNAKIHSKRTKSCQEKEYSIRVLKKAKKTISRISSDHLGQSKNDDFNNQVQEIFKSKTSIEVTQVSKVPKPVTSPQKNVQRLKNVTLSVGNKVINDISEITSIHTFECKKCQQICNSKQQLEHHKQVAHTAETSDCTSCHKTFTKNFELGKHHKSSPACLIQKNNSSKINNKFPHNPVAGTPVHCDQCKKSCKSLMLLRMHKNIKHGFAPPGMKLNKYPL